jgi:hypothetical protein
MRAIGSRGLSALAVTVFFICVPGVVDAADVWLYKITKGIHYEQVPGSAPAVLAENGCVFQANVFMTAPGSVSSATVVSPEGTVRTLAPEGSDELEFRNRVNTRSTLETRYPDGNFRFTINAVQDGQRVITLPMFGNNYPPPPFVRNLAALQSANANGYVVASWDPLGGGTLEDFIQLRIEEEGGTLAWESRDFGEPGALDGTATHVIIKPGNLKPNMTYRATLMFDKSCGRETAAYPGAFGWSTYHARTEFTIRTSAAGTPNVERYELTKSRRFEQASDAPPVPKTGDEFVFSAEVQASAARLVSGASVNSPAGRNVSLVAENDQEEFSFSESVSNHDALEAGYPAGNYILQTETATEGTRSMNLSFNSANYPPAPRVYFDPAQRIPADAALTIAWDAWPGATRDDFIQLRIEDEEGDTVFETPDFDDKDALDGRARSATVPAGTFVRGQEYEARLTFRRFVRLDAASYPGALGVASYVSRTSFDIETVPSDVRGYEVFKGWFHVQTSGSTTATGYVFRATVEAESAQTVASAIMTTPAGRTLALVQQSNGTDFEFVDAKASQALLDTDYPDGNYALVISTVNEGTRNIPVQFLNSLYPNAPRLTDYAAAGRIDSAGEFVLRWDPFAGGSATDSIDVQIEEMDGDEVFDTPSYGKNDALDGRATSVTLPANLLRAGRSYQARFHFEKVLRASDAGYPGVEGRVSYVARTYAGLATAGAGNPPLLQSMTSLDDGRMRLNLTTLDGGIYQIEGSANLIDWTPLGSVSATANLSTFNAPPPPPDECYFYRAMLVR